MGYRVAYQPGIKFRRQKTGRFRTALLTGMFFLLFLLCVFRMWPEGRVMLQGLIFSGDIAVTAAALENMTSDLRSGVSFFEALEEFCLHVIMES